MYGDMDVSRLLRFSEPRYFKKGEYICSEGDQGDEMYIILQGRAGIYIGSAVEGEILVADVGAGDFFGEMALFEKQPRSASCVAEQDTMCIAINQNNLKDFIVSCPEITGKILSGLCGRVRRMDEQLYKGFSGRNIRKKIPFAVPAGHKDCGHRDKSRRDYIGLVKMTCPVCGAVVDAESIRILPRAGCEILPNQRKVYQDFDPLWHLLRSCSGCGYINYHVAFLRLPDVPEKLLSEVLSEEKKGMVPAGENEFEKMAMDYYRVIHFNQCLNGEDTLLLAKLWLFLGWLYEDAGQRDMCLYCHEKSLACYMETYTKRKHLLYNDFAVSQCAMVMAELYYERGQFKKAKEFYHIASASENKRLAQQAFDRIYELRDREAEK